MTPRSSPDTGDDAAAPNPPAAPTLREQVTRGAAWTLSTRLAIQFLQMATTVVVARILTPRDYGLAAIVMTVGGFAAIYAQMGLAQALIQSRDLPEEKLATAFWLNVVIGVLLTLLLVAVSGPLAALFGEDELRPMFALVALNFTLSVGMVHGALLQRAMRFKAAGLINIGGAICSSAVTIVLAAVTQDAISIVAGTIATTVWSSLLLWIFVGWRPSARPTWRSARELWGFGGPLLGFNSLNYWARNIDNLLLGKFVGPAALGLYGRAFNLMLIPVQQVTTVFGQVLFPAYSKIRDDVPRLRAAYLKALWIMVAAGTPFAVALSCTAPTLIVVLYGEPFKEAALLLTILAASVPLQLVGGSMGTLYQALGRTGSQLRRGAIAIAITIAAIVAGLPWDAIGVATAVALKPLLTLPITTRGCWPQIGVTAVSVARQSVSTLQGSAVMAGAILLMHAVGKDALPDIGLLASELVAGFATYWAILRWRDPALLEELMAPVRRLGAGRGRRSDG